MSAEISPKPADTTDPNVQKDPVAEANPEPEAEKGSDAGTGAAAESEAAELEEVQKEVTEGQWKLPDVDLKAVEVVTGEEDEIVEWHHRAKLYRWNLGEWKERGLGEAKLLRGKDQKVRFLLRQERTGKIVANHYVLPIDEACILRPNGGSDKIWVWSVVDSAEDTPEVEQFGLRFGTTDAATKFKEEFERVGAANKKIYDQGNWDSETR